MIQKFPYRSIFCAPPGSCLIDIDLTAAESWVVAYLANDPNMKHQLSNGDLHSFSAQGIYDNPLIDKSDQWKTERFIGKKMNHSCGYRSTPPKVTEFINKEGGITVSLSQVKVWHAKWHSLFNIQRWWNEIDSQLNKDRTLITPYGKKRRFYEIWGNDLLKAATAFVPQSTVSYHMDGAIHPELGIAGGIIEIQNQITKHSSNADKKIKLIQTAHDSIVIECPNEISLEIAQRCSALLTRPLVIKGETFTIPVDCDRYPKRWKEDGERLVGDKFVPSK